MTLPQSRSRTGAPSAPHLVIEGGARLTGRIPISGSKNAALALMAGAALASEGVTVLRNLPRISDIGTMAEILAHLGVEVSFEEGGRTARIEASGLRGFEAPDRLVNRMRASLHLLGPVLGRMGRARLAQPGGCNIGARAIDLHIKGLSALGASIDVGHGAIFAEGPHDGLRGAEVYLDFPSVGATMNLLMAAALSEGVTVIENAAQEPDVEDLANLINAMGGHVTGQGTGLIRVEGVSSLHGTELTVSPDRIEAGTLGLAAATTAGDLLLEGANPNHLRPVLMKMSEMGLLIQEEPDGVRVAHPSPGTRLRAADVVAMPHPGIPTDVQQPFTAALCLADGTSMVTDKVYEGRFRHLAELSRMGARARWEGRTAIITGVESLSAAQVEATDLRAGAALVLAALAAEGTSCVFGVHHIDRGYELLTEKLAAVGARIWRAEPSNDNAPARP